MVPVEKMAAVRRICCTFLLTEGIELEGFLQKVRRVEGVPEDEMEGLFAVYERVRGVFPPDSEVISGRPGFDGPGDVLFDGDRVWLEDGDSARLNDAYAGLAAMANLIASNEAQECAFLEACFGCAPDAFQRARFYLMRLLTHIFHAMVFLYLGSLDGRLDRSEAVPEIGEYRLGAGAPKLLYGRVHLDRVFEGAWSPRFGEALRVVSGKHA